MINIQEMEQQAYTRDAELYNAIISLKRGDISAFDIIYQHTCKFMFYKADISALLSSLQILVWQILVILFHAMKIKRLSSIMYVFI